MNILPVSLEWYANIRERIFLLDGKRKFGTKSSGSGYKYAHRTTRMTSGGPKEGRDTSMATRRRRRCGRNARYGRLDYSAAVHIAARRLRGIFVRSSTTLR